MIGSALNQYRITASIGAGGMGEVFRARDTRLNRDVAVKVLPKDFVADADRLRRFEQEAKTLAALNHPNVLTIHDAGTATRALPVRKATEYALQIAHGLAAAHGKGIIHRDLKPENIFITKDGRVKIPDFGLAKLKDPSPALRAPSSLGGERGAEVDPSGPTLMNTTEPGMVLGTPAYFEAKKLYRISISGGRAMLICSVPEGSLPFSGGAWFADDQIIFSVNNEKFNKGKTGLYEVSAKVAFPGFTNRTILSHGGALKPEWHPNGSELFYLSLDGRVLISVPVKRDGAWQLSEPVKACDLPESIYAGGAFGENAFDVTSDGQKFLMLQTTKDESSPQPLPKPSALVVENWFEEFREKK